MTIYKLDMYVSVITDFINFINQRPKLTSLDQYVQGKGI